MLLSYKVNGFKVFNEEVTLNFKANKKIKNKDYVFENNYQEILKSAILYGPNNTGKSSLIMSLDMLKTTILNGKLLELTSFESTFNFFNQDKIISYEIEFIEENKKYKYILRFKYQEGIIDEILYVDDILILDRNKKNKNEKLNNAIELLKTYNNMLIISTLPDEFKKYTDAINNFFNKMIIINRYFDFNDVVKDVSNLSSSELEKFNNILKSADVSIENIKFNEKFDSKIQELKLFSEYMMNNKTYSMPSILSDSDGTKIFMLYILKIMKVMRTGGILVIDEIDRSLHTLLTKNIISIFNDENNKNMQLLATSHDLLLLDCLYLFRKDQVWFTYKDQEKVYLYSLDIFKANIDNQIRNKTMENYLKGLFGALPHPNIEQYIFDE